MKLNSRQNLNIVANLSLSLFYLDKGMMNTVSSMLRFEVDEGLLIIKIAMS
jgi:hypothetical protein